MSDVYIILTGAYGNVGDGVIRRRVLQWVQSHGTVHAYVGNAPSDWVEQLGLTTDERVYAAPQARQWVRSLMLGRGPRVLVFDPGQVPLGRGARKAEALYFGLTVWTRLRGGTVIRPPRAFAGKRDRLAFGLHRLGARFSQITLWRTPRCLAAIATGEFCPDTAFQEPFIEGEELNKRPEIVVSMRGKRALPSDAWFRGVEAISATYDARVVVLSQVREDEARGMEITARLQADGIETEMLPWGDRSDLEQEVAVRTRYESARFVISDRLHVLILAAKAGAIPLELTDQHPSKAEEHFSAIGFDGVSVLVTPDDVEQIEECARQAADRVSELQALMESAARAIDGHVQRMHDTLP